jgi:hypothetical protein
VHFDNVRGQEVLLSNLKFKNRVKIHPQPRQKTFAPTCLHSNPKIIVTIWAPKNVIHLRLTVSRQKTIITGQER